MADEPKTDPAPEPKAEEPNTQDKTFTQADLDRVVSDRLSREREKFGDYDDLKAKATRLAEIESANQSETEKLNGKVGSLSNENQSLKEENLRLRVALDKSVPADLIDRLRGKNKEELEADADKLLALVGTPKEEPKDPNFDGGPRDPAPDPKSPEEQHNDAVLGLLGLTPNSST